MANQESNQKTNHNKISPNGLIKQTEKHHLNDNNLVLVMVPFLAQGHLNQLLQLSRLILSSTTTTNISVHYLGTLAHNRQARLRVHGWDPHLSNNIHFHDLDTPPYNSSDQDEDAKVKFDLPHQLPSFFDSMQLARPVSTFLRAISRGTRKVVVVNDSLMATVVQEVRHIPNAESYTFHSVSAFAIYLFKRDQIKKLSPKESRYSNIIPKDVPSLDACFSSEFLNFINSQHNHHKLVNSGFIYNTSRIIEAEFMELLEKETRMEKNIKHFALGPFNPAKVHIKSKASKGSKHYCLDWLDKQEPNSVIYMSFGTTTAMNSEQIQELATGLKQSNQKFIWVLREADKGTEIFKGGVKEGRQNPVDELPKGYEESVKNRGLIVRDWAPQLEILAHDAVGGFMSHCGWNSCIESITMGVPIAAWPMHSDQPRNAVLVTRVLKVGVVVKEWNLFNGNDNNNNVNIKNNNENGENINYIVRARVVARCVKKLMDSSEGDDMRRRAMELSDSLDFAACEGGASRFELDSFISHITRSI